jgi:citrate synthase
VSARHPPCINVDPVNVDLVTAVEETGAMATFVGATEAARVLGVERATLYAYVSRGVVSRRTAVDGRTSLYALDELEALAQRSRRPPAAADRPTIDVQIVSGVTVLDEAGPSYRGHDVGELARSCTFEQVAELLWTGRLPPDSVTWPAPRDRAVRRCAAALDGYGHGLDWISRLAVIATAVGIGHSGDDPATAARRILTMVPVVLGGVTTGDDVADHAADYAAQVASVFAPNADVALVVAIRRAIVLLADHELATSTLAVRIAGSVRTDPYAAIAAGLAVVSGTLHGAAGAAASALIADCWELGAADAVRRRLAARERLPGFGHTIYRNEDPRFAVLLDAVRDLPDPDGRLAVIDDVLAEAGRAVSRSPNIDLALAALAFVGGFDPTAPLFAIARIAGWAAHLTEELGERPVRYRGLARRPA